ncbi:MAG TPA: DUF3551 domain-containing protein [Bradyrhizobium sp.]|jgi:hypothetical protein|nr:DUF3551 domain-containing protein [Bradyrhizobium sp.]
MRRSFQTAVMCFAFTASAALPAAAQDYPFCIKGCDFGAGPGDCIFSTYQQCLAAASGRVATCDANPYFRARAELQPGRGTPSRRRH